MIKLTHERLTQVLNYDPISGVFTWLIASSNRVRVGERAGVLNQNGRRYIAIDGEKFMAHRLAWFYANREWPKGDVRQQNDNYDDCSIDNLRDVPRTEQALRRNVPSTNTSGYRGVSPAKNGKWQASITRNYKQVNLGSNFATAEEASAAYEAAAFEIEGSGSEQGREDAAHKVLRRRRQRTAWNRLVESGARIAWKSLDEFASDIGDVQDTRMAIVAEDASKPIGPGNFRWSLDRKFDHSTRDGKAAYQRAHRAANPDLYRDKELRKNFGISLDDYLAKLDDQFGVCAVCERPETAVRNSRKLWLAVDHNHTTNAVRGLLCTNCNVAVGMLCDDPSLLRRAADYLDRYGDGHRVWSTPSVTEITHLPVGQRLLQEYAGNG